MEDFSFPTAHKAASFRLQLSVNYHNMIACMTTHLL
jgi:hypothetical protein